MNYKNEKYLNGEMYGWMLRCAASELKIHIKDVNELNVYPVPDGDTGDNMWRTINGGVNALETCKTDGLTDAVVTSSKGMLMGARGNSGVILSQFFKGITDVLSGNDRADADLLLEALQNGVRLSYAAVLNPTEGTILTVARESVESARNRIRSGSNLSDLFTELRSGMETSLRHTPELLPVLKEAGVIDSGGAGLLFIVSGFVSALTEDVAKTEYRYGLASDNRETRVYASREDTLNIDLFTSDDEMKYGYCTEILIRLQNSKTDIDAFDDNSVREFLSIMGDSVVYFRDGSLVKLHVHTLHPEVIMNYMHEYGEFLKLKIENMTLEHTDNDSPAMAPRMSSDNRHFTDFSTDADNNSGSIDVGLMTAGAEPKEMKLYGTVCVCTGAGFSETFLAMGADALVAGGQSLNPSAQDFLEAFEKVNAKNILVFPNNKNIILSARQAASMFDKADVHIIETYDLGQGYVGLAAMYPDETDVDVLIASVKEAIASSCSGSVSVAVKNGNFDGIAVTKGDYIGFIGKRIISSEHDLVSAAMLLADYLLTETGKNSVLTCFSGKDTKPFENSLLEKALTKKYPDVEIFFASGGQDIYSYIFVAG